MEVPPPDSNNSAEDQKVPLPSSLEPDNSSIVPSNSTNTNVVDAGRNLTDNLVCPICLDLFSDAVVLNCGHTFCFRWYAAFY
jgi:hypothetical protein